jgi:hypothetical protein
MDLPTKLEVDFGGEPAGAGIMIVTPIKQVIIIIRTEKVFMVIPPCPH